MAEKELRRMSRPELIEIIKDIKIIRGWKNIKRWY